MDKELKITSIKLYKEQTKFFKEKHISGSAFIRDLIEESKEYKRWKDER